MRRLSILILLLAVAGCHHTKSPSDTVRDVYQFCNAGKYPEAERLMSKDLVAGIAPYGGVKGFCSMNTRKGTISDIAITSEDIHGGNATVKVTFTYKNGNKYSDYPAPLVREDGVWKLALKTF